MIKVITLQVDTEKFRAFLDETGGGEDFTGILGLLAHDDQTTKDPDHSRDGFHSKNGVEVLSVAVEVEA